MNPNQRLHQERYWQRAISKTIRENEVRDQDLLREIHYFIDNPKRSESPLVARITDPAWHEAGNNDLIENLFPARPPGPPYPVASLDDLIRLYDSVIKRILDVDKSDSSKHSPGFWLVHSLLHSRIDFRPGKAPTNLADRLTPTVLRALSQSFKLTNHIFYNVATDRQTAILSFQDAKLRRTILSYAILLSEDQNRFNKCISGTDSTSLKNLLLQTLPRPVDLTHWIARPLLTGIRERNIAVIHNVIELLTEDGDLDRIPVAYFSEEATAKYVFNDRWDEVKAALKESAEAVKDPFFANLLQIILKSPPLQ